MANSLVVSDAIVWLDTMPDNIAQCCVTSPPYYGMRDYCHAGQIGLEETPDAYVSRLVAVFRALRRVLRDDGTCWLNLGDSYARAGGWSDNNGLSGTARGASGRAKSNLGPTKGASQRLPGSYKEKDLMGIPWAVAFALRADGWYLRADIIWHKPNPVPESAKDRCTRAHEYVFLLTKSKRYFYDAKALEEKAKYGAHHAKYQGTYARHKIEAMQGRKTTNSGSQYDEGLRRAATNPLVRNARSVWTVATRPYSGAHFATMPPELARRCVLAGSKTGSLIIDPFAGAGTTLLVAQQEGRDWAGCDINQEYVALAEKRLLAEMLGDLP